MEPISLLVEDRWISLQKGFAWNDIPAFAIVTGVNGAGKTHLMRLLGSTNQKNAAIFSSATSERFDLILPQPNNSLNLEGLIMYFNGYKSRLEQILRNKNEIKNLENTISSWEKRLNSIDDPGEKASLKENIKSYNNTILLYKDQIKAIVVYQYDKELENITKKLKIKYEELTEELIKREANPIFNDITEMDDFNNYVRQIESIKDSYRIKYCKEKKYDEIDLLEAEPKIHERINELFQKFDFHYFNMEDPFPIDKSRNGEIKFKGKAGEVIEYNDLSSGEQMIVKFIIWAMTEDVRGGKINTMILDEPDAHLHPGMCKMMVDILQDIAEPSNKRISGIRVIITTHSPSTVAFAPEGSLFILEKDENGNRSINPSNKQDAINILSEGIFTFDDAIEPFKIINKSAKNNILCVEGKTDVMHISTAMNKLGIELDIEVINLYNASALADFVKSVPNSLIGGRKIIGLFDNDDEGRKSSNIPGMDKFMKLSTTQCDGRAYVCVLPAPDAKLDKYCPIEFLYPMNILKENSVLEKRIFKQYKSMYKASDPTEDKEINEEFNNETTLRPFKANDRVKNLFAEHAVRFDQSDFQGFIPLFDLIKEIILDDKN